MPSNMNIIQLPLHIKYFASSIMWLFPVNSQQLAKPKPRNLQHEVSRIISSSKSEFNNNATFYKRYYNTPVKKMFNTTVSYVLQVFISHHRKKTILNRDSRTWFLVPKYSEVSKINIKQQKIKRPLQHRYWDQCRIGHQHHEIMQWFIC